MRIPQRAQVIIDLIQANDYKRIAEIGVCKGETAMPVMAECDLDYYLLVDPQFNYSLGLDEYVINYPEVHSTDMTSVDAAAIMQDGAFDLVFVDAIHDEENVDRDCRLWKPKVRKGGIMCGHDYDNKRFPGVKIAVDRIFGEVETKPVKMCKVWIARL